MSAERLRSRHLAAGWRLWFLFNLLYNNFQFISINSTAGGQRKSNRKLQGQTATEWNVLAVRLQYVFLCEAVGFILVKTNFCDQSLLVQMLLSSSIWTTLQKITCRGWMLLLIQNETWQYNDTCGHFKDSPYYQVFYVPQSIGHKGWVHCYTSLQTIRESKRGVLVDSPN